MEDHQSALVTHFLYPATLFAHSKPHIVTTILGSCVSVCLWDREKAIGGINHYMLPLWNGDGLPSPKYGTIAIERLIEKMYKLGSKPEHIVAKLFGGSNRIESAHSQFKIGKRNILLAQEMLAEKGIPVVSGSLGGTRGRKIHFNTATGEVLMKLLPSSIPDLRPAVLPYEKPGDY